MKRGRLGQPRTPVQRVCLVVGACHPLAREAARELLEDGATVVLLDRQRDPVNELTSALQEQYGIRRAFGLVLDYTQPSWIKRAAAEVLNRYQRLDAAIIFTSRVRTLDHYLDMMTAQVHLLAALAPLLSASEGRLVFALADVAGNVPAGDEEQAPLVPMLQQLQYGALSSLAQLEEAGQAFKTRTLAADGETLKADFARAIARAASSGLDQELG